MPANLSPEYKEAEKAYRQAQGSEEKLAALQRMLSTIPKHKGTDKLQADLKRRIKQLKEEVQTQGKKKGFAIHVDKQGAAQVAVVGPPNVGKSQLVTTLTGVDLAIAPYPFTTTRPQPAMMPFEDIQVQLVDLPAISSTHMESWVPGLIRNADAVLLVVNLGAGDILGGLEDVLTTLTTKKIELKTEVEATDPWASIAARKTLLVGTKLDTPEGADNWEVVQELYGERFPGFAVSGETGEGSEILRVEIFRMLAKVRVYAKQPQKEPDMSKPFVLDAGATVTDFANHVHKDFAARLKFARVWGDGKYDGQRVNREYALADQDIIELHL